MKKLIFTAVLFAALASSGFSQQVSVYQSDSNDNYYQTQKDDTQSDVVTVGKNRVKSHVNIGTGFSKNGSYEFINPGLTYSASKKLDLSFSAGLMYSNFKTPVLSIENNQTSYENMRALTNYYSAQARYYATEKLMITGSLIYQTSSISGGALSSRLNNDGYIISAGAIYQITPSLSVGFEVNRYNNINPYGIGYYDGFNRF